MIPHKGGVVICWKIRIFAYWTTPPRQLLVGTDALWFAEKFVSLLIEQHLLHPYPLRWSRCDLLKNSYLCLLNNTMTIAIKPCLFVVICWKIRIFAYWTTPSWQERMINEQLWFAEKFVSLLIEQHLRIWWGISSPCCDLLKNSYLCLLNNTFLSQRKKWIYVVICWKIRIFAYWTTPNRARGDGAIRLWFAEKFVSLLIEQHPPAIRLNIALSCDLLKNSYLCLLNNTTSFESTKRSPVVICWKIRIFAYWTTPSWRKSSCRRCCDLLKNSYLCLLNNTS